MDHVIPSEDVDTWLVLTATNIELPNATEDKVAKMLNGLVVAVQFIPSGEV